MNATAYKCAPGDIPAAAFVPCPKVGFENVRVAKHCPGCAHFGGFMLVDKMPPARFTEAARVVCAHPILRRMIHVNTGD